MFKNILGIILAILIAPLLIIWVLSIMLGYYRAAFDSFQSMYYLLTEHTLGVFCVLAILGLIGYLREK